MLIFFQSIHCCF